MKVSEITLQNVASYLRIDGYTSEMDQELQPILDAAIGFVSSYTGIPISSEDDDVETLDSFESFYIAVMVLCSDMYDNRAMTVEKNNANKVVESILSMHRRNFL